MGSVADRDLDRMIERWEREPRPLPLPYDVVERTGRRRECAPVPVRAVIPVHYSYVETLNVEGEVVAWTDRAVLVEARLTPHSAPQRVWVWAGAVTRTIPRPSAAGDR